MASVFKNLHQQQCLRLFILSIKLKHSCSSHELALLALYRFFSGPPVIVIFYIVVVVGACVLCEKLNMLLTKDNCITQDRNGPFEGG